MIFNVEDDVSDDVVRRDGVTNRVNGTTEVHTQISFSRSGLNVVGRGKRAAGRYDDTRSFREYGGARLRWPGGALTYQASETILAAVSRRVENRKRPRWFAKDASGRGVVEEWHAREAVVMNR